ncbi:MAG: alcohol dehydrogenase catalytic domain-containing protein [Vulcanimicrobiaceae bacterium]
MTGVKAAVVTSADAPWEIQDVATPEPGPNQVVIKIHASGLCYTDVHQAGGHFGMPYPMRLGHEPVGEIVSLGVGVTKRRVGDRVGVPWLQSSCGRCEWCSRGLESNCATSVQAAIHMPGGHAEYLLAFADATMLLPDGLSYEQAAPIFCAGYTVYSGLRIAEPQPNERIAIVGIGGLGHLALQYARAAGFHTTAVTTSADKVELARSLGADEVVRDGAELAKSGGVDVVLATSNSNEAMTQAIDALRPDGRLVVMGVDGGTPFTFSPLTALAKRVRIVMSSQNGRRDLYEALDVVAQGRVKVMTETFALNDIAHAYDRVVNGDVRFRAVILPGT